MITNKKFVYIDSNNRLNGTHSNFSYNLKLSNIGDYSHVCVASVNIPKSYYLIEEGENTFILQENTNNITVTIPAGNYNRTNLKTTLVTLLNDASVLGITYSISTPLNTDADTGKYTFSCTNNMIQPTLIFSTFVYEQLGFERNSTNAFVSDTLVSTNVIKLQLEDSIFIHSSLVDNGSDNILQDISAVDNPAFANITWVCPNIETFSKNITKADRVASFRITDELDSEIDTNGLNIVMTLILFKSEDITKLLRSYIKYNILKE